MYSKEINLLDLFSGIGGFAKGLEDGGFVINQHFFSEVDRHPIANYQFNFKNSVYAGPIQSVSGPSLPQVDVITFGSPCQDFSIAGQRAGLDGQRSSLLLEAIRLITEKRPSFFIWENVKGAFSSNNSEDFWAILQAFANIGGYNIEWQCVNTLWLLPQNRERIYLVGHLATPGRDFAPIFPITKDDRLFNEQKASRKGQPQTEYSGTISGDIYRADNTFIRIPEIAGTLTGGGNSGGLHSDMTTIRVINTQPRSGDPKKGGTGLLEKFDETYCLDTSNSTAIQIENERYRRLTEIECERLQGFQDDWTKKGLYFKSKKVIKYLDKEIWLTPTAKGIIYKHAYKNFIRVEREIKQTNRYKMIGNAVTKLFPQIIAQQLIENYKL
ncbi:DNA cytosine methyltransferase [Flavobacterium sp. PLA-1-15]|uniref:DNA cytosine methyltransferase n=1 Tax=Flavobacterium sp. PLA-1-15 TaxID=3380533 RepID=UPI003B796B14